MDLNINTELGDANVGVCLNIKQERITELNELMDKYCDSFGDVVSLANSVKVISTFCKTIEELAYCMLTHGIWCGENLKLE